MLKAGDWVTQYSAGYWQVVAVYPKFADEDYVGEKVSWKKGDRLGDWVVVKKGLTPKMKFSNACEFVDSAWCKAVTREQADAIEAAFLCVNIFCCRSHVLRLFYVSAGKNIKNRGVFLFFCIGLPEKKHSCRLSLIRSEGCICN